MLHHRSYKSLQEEKELKNKATSKPVAAGFENINNSNKSERVCRNVGIISKIIGTNYKQE